MSWLVLRNVTVSVVDSSGYLETYITASECIGEEITGRKEKTRWACAQLRSYVVYPSLKSQVNNPTVCGGVLQDSKT